MKTNDIPLKSPMKLQQEMQKKFWIFQNLSDFRALFEKAVFLENGHGRQLTVAMPIQNRFIFRETQWGSPPESFIQKCWLVSEIQSFEVENYFLGPFSLWNCAFLTIFDFKALYFWNQSIFLNEFFRSASSLRFAENEAILDGHGNCLMPATPTLLFQKMP